MSLRQHPDPFYNLKNLHLSNHIEVQIVEFSRQAEMLFNGPDIVENICKLPKQ